MSDPGVSWHRFRFMMRRFHLLAVLPDGRSRIPVIATRLCAVLVVVLGAWMGLTSMASTAAGVFRYAPPKTIGDEYRRDLMSVRRWAPPGTPFFYITREPEDWFSRLWQRMFYPDPVFIVQGEGEWSSARTRSIRDKYRIRYAFSAGDPPIDPGYEWRVSLTPNPAAGHQLWFGELRDDAAGR